MNLQNNNSEVQIIGKVIHIKTVEQAKGRGQISRNFFRRYRPNGIGFVSRSKMGSGKFKNQYRLCYFWKSKPIGATFNMAHPEMELLDEHKASLQLW